MSAHLGDFTTNYMSVVGSIKDLHQATSPYHRPLSASASPAAPLQKSSLYLAMDHAAAGLAHPSSASAAAAAAAAHMAASGMWHPPSLDYADNYSAHSSDDRHSSAEVMDRIATAPNSMLATPAMEASLISSSMSSLLSNAAVAAATSPVDTSSYYQQLHGLGGPTHGVTAATAAATVAAAAAFSVAGSHAGDHPPTPEHSPSLHMHTGLAHSSYPLVVSTGLSAPVSAHCHGPSSSSYSSASASSSSSSSYFSGVGVSMPQLMSTAPTGCDGLYASSVHGLAVEQMPTAMPIPLQATASHDSGYAGTSDTLGFSPLPPLGYSMSSGGPMHDDGGHAAAAAAAAVAAAAALCDNDPLDMSDSFSTCSPQLQTRFQVVLEAPTAAAQRIEHGYLTYINKGQYYNLALSDHHKEDCVLETTLRIMFYEKAHRQIASAYWRYWLSQQTSPNTARAIEVNTAALEARANGSESKYRNGGNNNNGGSSVSFTVVPPASDGSEFDCIRIRWHSQRGATLQIRLNCLSTEFTRVKGVKGIPMRIIAETHMYASADGLATEPERVFAAVKLFRDKGAERKNKDDMRHRHRVLQRVQSRRGVRTVASSSGAGNDRSLTALDALPVAHAVTMFVRDPHPLESAELERVLPASVRCTPAIEPDAHLHRSESMATGGSMDGSPAIGASVMLPGVANSAAALSALAANALDVDPSYIPRPPQQAALSLFILLPNESLYRAVYLDELSSDELRTKLCQRLGLHPDSVQDPIRKTISPSTEQEVLVALDDTAIAHITDQQAMGLSLQMNPLNGLSQIILEF